MRRAILLCAALLWCGTLWAVGIEPLRGSVTCEGVGIAGVVVTDGESFTTTDDKGRFVLDSSEDNTLIYITIPSGYEVESKDSVPQFWMKKERGRKSYNFLLEAKAQDDNHHGFVVIADPQIWHEKEFKALSEGMDDIRHTVEGYDIPFHGICCGDVISYDHSFYAKYNSYAATTGLDFFSTPGNHDMTLYSRSHETSTRLWEQTFGPTYYSFDVGKAHYVVLNDNFYIGRDYFYIGYLDERQFAWLEQDLKYVDEGSTLFIILHIPTTCDESDRKQFSYNNIANVMTNAPQLHRLLAPYNCHILSGHTHTTFNQIINDNLYEHVMPALSGAWWQGTLCTDGTPRGYGVFEIEGDEVSWYYKSTGEDANHQMAIYDGGDYPQFEGLVVANVWAVDDRWHIEAQFDDGQWQTMERFTTYDPAAQAMYADRDKLDHAYVYPSAADHFFRIAKQDGATKCVVRATDGFGREYCKTITLK